MLNLGPLIVKDDIIKDDCNIGNISHVTQDHCLLVQMEPPQS